MTGNNRGLSLFEMLLVVAMIGTLAIAAVPVAELAYIRTQEQLLEENLELIRSAIKDWKIDCRMALTRQIQSEANAAEIILDMPDALLHPPSLVALANPDPSYSIEWKHNDLTTDFSAMFYPRKYLQRIPTDPFVGRPAWKLHYTDGTTGEFDGIDPSTGAHRLFDVSPVSDLGGRRRGFVQAIDGTKYEYW